MPATCSVMLNAKDIQRSYQFYRDLGFKDVYLAKGEDGRVYYADLTYQGADLGLASIPENDDPEFREWVSTPLGAGVVVYMSVPNVDKVYEKAKAIGATIETPPTDRFYGRVMTLNDPDGYTLTFIKESKPAPVKPVKAKKAAAKAKRPAKKAAAKKAPARKAPARKAAKKTAKKAAAKKRSR